MIAALILLALIAGVVYENMGKRRAAREFPPQGKLVDIGGRRMQLDCRGAGSPTVVFEAGLDLNGSLSWAAVHDEVARTTRACAYSRAGIMWSDPQDGPQNASTVAQDLHAMLAGAVRAMAAYASTSRGALLKELEAIDQTLAEAGTSRQLGARLVLVLTAMAPLPENVRAALGLTAKQGVRYKEIWGELHAEAASWSSRGRQRLVADADHYTQFDRPDLVVEAIRSVVDDVRAHR